MSIFLTPDKAPIDRIQHNGPHAPEHIKKDLAALRSDEGSNAKVQSLPKSRGRNKEDIYPPSLAIEPLAVLSAEDKVAEGILSTLSNASSSQTIVPAVSHNRHSKNEGPRL
jgi:hypothetical protein